MPQREVRQEVETDKPQRQERVQEKRQRTERSESEMAMKVGREKVKQQLNLCHPLNREGRRTI